MTDLVAQLVGALQDCLDRIEKSEFWGMDCPDRGGFDAEAIRAALSAAKDGGWLPIETCPRDFGGTKFDVWANGQRYADCWWGKATYEQGECGVVYQSDYDCNGPVDSYVKGATAWQPLPNPPKGEV